MAKKTGGATRNVGRGTTRATTGRGGEMRGARTAGTSRATMGEVEVEYVASPGERAGRQGRGEQGMLSSVAERGREAGEAGLGAARRVASTTRDAAVGAAEWTQDSVAEVVRYVKDHPWPTLLIGAGATWLAIDSIRGRGENGERRRTELRDTRNEGRGMMRRTASTVAGASRDAGHEIERFVRERPLLAGAAAMGVGMAVGMALPGTLSENRMLGEARDAVMDRARQAASGTARAAREVARSASRITGGGGSGRGER